MRGFEGLGSGFGGQKDDAKPTVLGTRFFILGILLSWVSRFGRLTDTAFYHALDGSVRIDPSYKICPWNPAITLNVLRWYVLQAAIA